MFLVPGEPGSGPTEDLGVSAPRILLIDDDATFRRVITVGLEGQGYRVIVIRDQRVRWNTRPSVAFIAEAMRLSGRDWCR